MIIFLPTLMILSAVSSAYLGFTDQDKLLFFQRVLLTSGGIMVFQTLWGHRYPLLDGPSSALLLSLLILAPGGMPAIQGGMISGGILLCFLSGLGLMKRLQALFTDQVVGVTLILIAITLLPYLAPLVIGRDPGRPQGDPAILGISLGTVLAISLFSQKLSGFFRAVSLLLGIGLGTFLMGVLERMPFPPPLEGPWLAFPGPLSAGLPRFSLSAILPFLVAYLAVIINGVGSIYSIGEVVGKGKMEERISRGIGVTGLAGLLAGALGSIGTVSFGISPGVVLMTRVGSRYPVTFCGIFLCLLAFFHKVLLFLMSIPPSVVGAALLAAMASQVGAGISILTRLGKGMDSRDYLVVGLPILLGGVITLLPETFFQTLSPGLQAFLKNGLAVGIVAVLFLEHVFLRTGKPDRRGYE